MDGSNERRIVIVGKTGAGKSSLANTIFGEELFKISHDPNSETGKCQAKYKSVNGRSITLIDTPGFFDTDRSEEELEPEIVRCITECAPGPHAFIIVLKVERFTKHEQEVINKIQEYFSEEAFKYATVLFTHGEQLPEGETIEDFVFKNSLTSDLVKKCGGRCHVTDNRYWNKKPTDEYRSNQFQVEELLKTIDKMVMANNGRCYTNEMLQEVEEEIQQEEENIRLLSGNLSKEGIRKRAQDSVFDKLLKILAGVGTGALLGAFFGATLLVGIIATALRESSEPVQLREAVARTLAIAGGSSVGMIGGALGGGAAGLSGASLITVASIAATVGAVDGALKGCHAAEGADTPWEAAKVTAVAIKDQTQSVLNQANCAFERLTQSKFKHAKK